MTLSRSQIAAQRKQQAQALSVQGVSPAEIASRIGVSRSTVYGYLSDANFATASPSKQGDMSRRLGTIATDAQQATLSTVFELTDDLYEGLESVLHAFGIRKSIEDALDSFDDDIPDYALRHMAAEAKCTVEHLAAFTHKRFAYNRVPLDDVHDQLQQLLHSVGIDDKSRMSEIALDEITEVAAIGFHESDPDAVCQETVSVERLRYISNSAQHLCDIVSQILPSA